MLSIANVCSRYTVWRAMWMLTGARWQVLRQPNRVKAWWILSELRSKTRQTVSYLSYMPFDFGTAMGHSHYPSDTVG
jgi:hypothetical protein